MNEFTRKLSGRCASSGSIEANRRPAAKTIDKPPVFEEPQIQKVPDDMIFVYRKYNMFKVYGVEQATRNQERLKDKGFEHIATISASVWMEKLLNSSQDKNILAMIEDLRNE